MSLQSTLTQVVALRGRRSAEGVGTGRRAVLSWKRLTVSLISVVTLACAALPASAQAVNYGDNALDNCNAWTPGNGNPASGGTLPTCDSWDPAAFANYSPWGDNPFTQLRQALYEKGGRTAYERVFVPWDAIGYYNGISKRCAYSPAYTTGGEAYNKYASGPSSEFSPEPAGEAWALLLDKLRQIKATSDAAVAAGYGPLKPEIEFDSGTGIGNQAKSSMAYTHDGITTHLVPSWPDPNDKIDRYDDACGVYMTMTRLDALAQSNSQYPQVGEYEAMNEPDNAKYMPVGGSVKDTYATKDANGNGGSYFPYNGSKPNTSNARWNGEWKVAYLWAEADAEARLLDRPGHGHTMAAYTGSHPNDNAYFNPYFKAMTKIVTCTTGGWCRDPGLPHGAGSHMARSEPKTWAVHDYYDPTAGGTKDLKAFENHLATLQANTPAGDKTTQVWVTEAGVHLDEPATSDLNRSGCTHESDDAGTLGACVNGQPAAQFAGAKTWKSLGGITAKRTGSARTATVKTAELFWYYFALGGPPQYFDSAMLTPTGPNSSYQPRASFCALTGQSLSCATGDSEDYADANEPPKNT